MKKRSVLWVLLVTCAALVPNPVPSEDSKSLCKGFLPENPIRIPVATALTANGPTGITRAQFDSILNKIYDEYAPEIAGLGANFRIDRRWNDPVLNAYAFQANGNWYIAMYGGLARHPAMTEDGFMAVACHEVGHHLGGAPKFVDDDWGSVEGQADYYATLKCLRRIFMKEDNAKILANTKLDPIAIKRCEAEGLSQQDEEICIRSVMAGASLASVLSVMNKNKALPKLDTPDRSRVTTTDENHPRSQCRMDTYLQGALCRVRYTEALDNKDYRAGTCADESLYDDGLRPSCWFSANSYSAK